MTPVYRAFFDFDHSYKWCIEKGVSHGYSDANNDRHIRYSHKTDTHYTWRVPTNEIHETLEKAKEYVIAHIHQEIEQLYEDIIRIKTEEVN